MQVLPSSRVPGGSPEKTAQDRYPVQWCGTQVRAKITARDANHPWFRAPELPVSHGGHVGWAAMARSATSCGAGACTHSILRTTRSLNSFHCESNRTG